MLSINTKKRIKEQKMLEHTNASQFYARIKKQSKDAMDDLALIAKNLDEKHIQKIFNRENLEPLVNAIMHPPSTKHNAKPSREELDRVFELGYMMIKSSIDVTGISLGNRYAQRIYDLHKKNFLDTLDLLYSDRQVLKVKGSED